MDKQAAIQSANRAIQQSKELLGSKKLTQGLLDEFNSIFKEATAMASGMQDTDLIKKHQNKITDHEFKANLLAQVDAVKVVDKVATDSNVAAYSSAVLNEDNFKLFKNKKRNISLDDVDAQSVAQVNTGVVGAATKANPEELNIVPLQIFLDNAIKALNRVSKQEFRMNNLIDAFVDGKVSEDQVVLETAKLNLSISMVTTIVQNVVTTFKEIQNIPI